MMGSAIAQFPDSPFERLVGKWNHINSGESILITAAGDVWSTAGPQARTSPAIEGGGNFAFEGRSNGGFKYRCVYYIAFLANDVRTNWRLSVKTPSDANCPDGIYERVNDTPHPPRPVNRVELKPDTPLFDSTGANLLWYWRAGEAEYEFFDGPGSHPRNAEPLKPAIMAVFRQYEDELRKKGERLEAAIRCDRLAANPNDNQASGEGVPYAELGSHAAAAVMACESAVPLFPNELRFQYQLGRALELTDSGCTVTDSTPLNLRNRPNGKVITELPVSSSTELFGTYLDKSKQWMRLEDVSGAERGWVYAGYITCHGNGRQRAFKIHQGLVGQRYAASFDNLGSMYFRRYMYFSDKNDLTHAVKLFRQGIRLGDPDAMLSLAQMIEANLITPATQDELPGNLRRRAANVNKNVGYAGPGPSEQLDQMDQQKMFVQFMGTLLQGLFRR
jgi:TPR repeat protein